MSKSKHSAEWRTDIVKKYLLGEGSFVSVKSNSVQKTPALRILSEPE